MTKQTVFYHCPTNNQITIIVYPNRILSAFGKIHFFVIMQSKNKKQHVRARQENAVQDGALKNIVVWSRAVEGNARMERFRKVKGVQSRT